jgi:hypothetical protein
MLVRFGLVGRRRALGARRVPFSRVAAGLSPALVEEVGDDFPVFIKPAPLGLADDKIREQRHLLVGKAFEEVGVVRVEPLAIEPAVLRSMFGDDPFESPRQLIERQLRFLLPDRSDRFAAAAARRQAGEFALPFCVARCAPVVGLDLLDPRFDAVGELLGGWRWWQEGADVGAEPQRDRGLYQPSVNLKIGAVVDGLGELFEFAASMQFADELEASLPAVLTSVQGLCPGLRCGLIHRSAALLSLAVERRSTCWPSPRCNEV